MGGGERHGWVAGRNLERSGVERRAWRAACHSAHRDRLRLGSLEWRWRRPGTTTGGERGWGLGWAVAEPMGRRSSFLSSQVGLNVTCRFLIYAPLGRHDCTRTARRDGPVSLFVLADVLFFVCCVLRWTSPGRQHHSYFGFASISKTGLTMEIL